MFLKNVRPKVHYLSKYLKPFLQFLELEESSLNIQGYFDTSFATNHNKT